VSVEDEAWHLAQPVESSAYEPEETAALYAAINRLSDVDKAFVLLYLEDRPYDEMADILGITQNNVRVKMHRVQEKLRKLLVHT
jgi:RNA polymerase sigma factor (sigma-70 family)